MADRNTDFRYRILNKNNKVLFCGLLPEETDLVKELDSSSMKISSCLRGGMFENDIGTVFAFSSSKDHLKSSKAFKKELEVICNCIGLIEGVIEQSNIERNKSTSRLIHNLTSLNAHNIQEIYSLIPQDKVSKKMGKQISFVEQVVKEEPEETALVLLKIAKNNAAMKTEFSVFKKLFDSDPELKKMDHNLHKVMMNVFYLFFPDFTDKSVRVIVGDSDNSYSAYFDYESMHVAFYHLIENAAKYVRQDTVFNVGMKCALGKTEIIMDMISTEITNSEVNRIFEEGISGDLAVKTGKSGDGIGLSRAKKIVELNQGSLSVIPHPETSEIVMGVTYQRNVFIITLPRRK